MLLLGLLVYIMWYEYEMMCMETSPSKINPLRGIKSMWVETSCNNIFNFRSEVYETTQASNIHPCVPENSDMSCNLEYLTIYTHLDASHNVYKLSRLLGEAPKPTY
jgi:hypothetical protein